MRRGKLDGPPEVKKRDSNAWVEQTREYRLITPLFGGGVEAGKPDSVTAVRGASVRGQLRFWWRATRVGRYATLKELKAAEDRLWGAASQAALVELAVEVLDAGRDFTYQTQQGSSSPYSYVAFPLQQEHGIVREGVRFALRLRWPVKWKDEAEAALFAGAPTEEIEATLWAWESFGGVGARTRRGFGAIECLAVDGRAPAGRLGKDEVSDWLTQQVSRYVVAPHGEQSGLRYVPRLHQDMRWYRSILARRAAPDRTQEALGAWRLLFDKLKAFRQPRPPGADDPRRPGRSRWPEPEAIRTITGQRLPRHQELPGSGKFPRAVFGLPIIYQFKDHDKRERNPNRSDIDPAQTSLQGRDEFEREVERLASPLILRPLAVADGVVSLALVLDTPRLPPGGLILKRSRDRHTLGQVDATLTPAEGATIRDQAGQRPLLRGSTDVLEAFLNYLEQ